MALIRNTDFGKSEVNRKLIVWVFLLTGIMSLIVWGVGAIRSKLGVNADSGWIKPLKISYKVERKGLKLQRDSSRQTGWFLEKIKNQFAGKNGQYAVLVYRLKDGIGYGINEDEIMPAASIMKVPIMVATLKAIESGRLTIETEYVLRDEDKQSGSGPIEFMEAGTKLTVGQMIKEMGLKSDNSAAVILSNIVGRERIRNVLKELDMQTSDFDANTTTARDVGSMWVKLDKGEIINSEHWALMKEDLIDSIYEERIPAGVPEVVRVVHKVGTGDATWADAGIMECDGENTKCRVDPVVMVILNKDIDFDEAKNVVPGVAKMIWEYESNLAVEKEAKDQN